MKTAYAYVAAAAAIVVLVVGIMLLYQTPSAASVGKTAQYQQSSLNQNPTQNAQNTPLHLTAITISEQMKIVLVMATVIDLS